MNKKFNFIICFTLFFLLINTPFVHANNLLPPSVVVVGGGPAGLATAIEAYQNGAHVTLIEKREEYLRNQFLFLNNTSLKLLEKWQVTVPEMNTICFDHDICIGFVNIKLLEQALEKRVKEFGIEKIHGEFIAFKEGEKIALISSPDQEITLPYDILVAADGSHSLVSKKLNLFYHHLGHAKGACAILHTKNSEIDISNPIKINEMFVRRIAAPSLSIILLQNAQGSKDISRKTLEETVRYCGWEKEGDLIAKEEGIFLEDVEIFLQQVSTFSNLEKSVLIVGDAAATASFFQGLGANMAFKTASIAGNFFKQMQENQQKAFDDFNQNMKEVTDELIENSRFLFSSQDPS